MGFNAITYGASKKYVEKTIKGAGGLQGTPGKSAFEIAKEIGFEGTEEDWIKSLQGEDGISPEISATKEDGVTTVTIKDSNGTHTVELKDGTNGQDGNTGEIMNVYLHIQSDKTWKPDKSLNDILKAVADGKDVVVRFHRYELVYMAQNSAYPRPYYDIICRLYYHLDTTKSQQRELAFIGERHTQTGLPIFYLVNICRDKNGVESCTLREIKLDDLANNNKYIVNFVRQEDGTYKADKLSTDILDAINKGKQVTGMFDMGQVIFNIADETTWKMPLQLTAYNVASASCHFHGTYASEDGTIVKDYNVFLQGAHTSSTSLYDPERVVFTVKDVETGLDDKFASKELYGDIVSVGRKSGTTVGDSSFAFGVDVIASGNTSFAIGSNSEAKGKYSYAEGQNTHAEGDYSHAEGATTVARGTNSHAEGSNTAATGGWAHAEGYSTVAGGEISHAEGRETNATNSFSHSEGYKTTASGQIGHAEGFGTTASGQASHSEGADTVASGHYSHAEGDECVAGGNRSHAEGLGTKASGKVQHIQGKYNVEDTESIYAHIVGGGSSNDDRKNIHTLDWEGNAMFTGNVTANGKLLAKTTDNYGDELTAFTLGDNFSLIGNRSGDVFTKIGNVVFVSILLKGSSTTLTNTSFMDVILPGDDFKAAGYGVLDAKVIIPDGQVYADTLYCRVDAKTGNIQIRSSVDGYTMPEGNIFIQGMYWSN